MTYQQDVVTVCCKALHLAVNLRDQRAGCVNGLLVALLRCFDDCWGNSVSGENHDATLWGLINFIHEYCAALFERSHHVLVVDNLLANIDRSTVVIQCLFNRDYRAVYACAVASWGC